MRNRNLWVLVGTCSTWFLLDIAFYAQARLVCGGGTLTHPIPRPVAALWASRPSAGCWTLRIRAAGRSNPILHPLSPTPLQNLFLPRMLHDSGFAPAIALPAAACWPDRSCPGPYGGGDHPYRVPPTHPELECVGACAAAVYERVWRAAAGNFWIALLGTGEEGEGWGRRVRSRGKGGRGF